MKMSKRDIQLLILLGLVVIIAGYYWFLFVPQEAKMAALKQERDMTTMQKNDMDLRFDTEVTLDSNLQDIHDQLLVASDRYYGNLFQEQLVMTINELTQETSLLVKGISFTSEVKPIQELMTTIQEAIDTAKANAATTSVATANTETAAATSETTAPADNTQAPAATPVANIDDPSAQTHISTIIALVQFEGAYADLEAFMYNVFKYPKQMVIQSVNVTSSIEGNLSGVIALQFHGMPKIGLVDQTLKDYFTNSSTRASTADAFMPYETFVMPTIDEGLDAEAELPDDFDNESDLIDNMQNSQLISSFEMFDYFYAGNSPIIVGSASRTAVRTNGSYGLKINYNFVEAKDQNLGNVIFDQTPIYVNKPGSALTLSMYTDKLTKNRVGAEIIDALGTSYEVTFATELSGRGWETFQAQLPEYISYPFIVKRIFVEGTGLNQQLSGEIIIDELKLVLMGNEEGSNNE